MKWLKRILLDHISIYGNLNQLTADSRASICVSTKCMETMIDSYAAIRHLCFLYVVHFSRLPWGKSSDLIFAFYCCFWFSEQKIVKFFKQVSNTIDFLPFTIFSDFVNYKIVEFIKHVSNIINFSLDIKKVLPLNLGKM